MNQETQETLAGGGGNSGGSTTGFSTGTTCTSSGTYRCSNKYMDVIAIFAAGDTFLKGPDGKNTTWFRLTPTLTTVKSGGSWEPVKVPAGTL